ncbi:MAG: tetratricopeptide repeat protein [bacterium]|nr:tetratricopeptide repeat protein [bacterium]
MTTNGGESEARPDASASILLPPSSTGRFDFVRSLGSGAHGQVDLVRDRADGAEYALKSSTVAFGAFALRHEFQLLGRVAHPQVPAAFDLGRDDATGRAFLLLSHLQGADLEATLRKLGRNAARPLLAQALNVLGFLHERGVVHGDVKSENLVVTESGSSGTPVLRLVDFGLAREVGAAPDPCLGGGTPAFMSRALLAGEPSTFVSDLHALGRSFELALERARIDPDPDLRKVLHHLVHDDPDLGYGSAFAPLCELVESDSTLRTILGGLVTATPRFVGRGDQRRLAREKYRSLLKGGTDEVLHLVGPAGFGKSRLLEELRRDAVLWGLRTECVWCGRASQPSRWVSDLAARVTGEPRAGVAQGPSGQMSERACLDLALRVRERGAAQPLVLFVDDVDAADEESRTFLRHLLGARSERGVLFVATTEPEADVDAVFSACPVTRSELTALDDHEIDELARSLLFVNPEGARLAHDVAACAQGDPRLATELAVAMGVAGSPRDSERGADIAALLGARLQALDPRDRVLLDALAVLGCPAPRRVLEDVVHGPMDQDSLHRLVAAGLASSELRSHGRWYSISTELLRARLIEDASDEVLKEDNARAFRAWLAWPHPSERPAVEVVRHALRSRNEDRAIELGVRAARDLLQRGALKQAAEWAKELLEASAHSEHASFGCELELILAEAELKLGRPERVEEVLSPRLERVDGAEHRASILRLLGSAREARGDLHVAREMLQQALSSCAVASDSDEVLRVRERLGAVHFRLGELETAHSVWSKGVAGAVRRAPSPAVADLLNNLGVGAARREDFTESARYHERALAARRELGDVDGEARSLHNLGSCALEQGDFKRGRQLTRQALALKRQVGSPQLVATSLGNLAILDARRGDYGDALRHTEESLSLRRRIGDRVGEGTQRLFLADLLLDKGECRSAARELAFCRELFESTGAIAAQRAALLSIEARSELVRGRVADAIESSSAALESLASQGNDKLAAGLYRTRGAARRAAGQHALGAQDLDEAIRASDRSGDPWEIAWSHLERARAFLGDDDTDGARQSVERSVALAAGRGCPLLSAETELIHAELVIDVDTDLGFERLEHLERAEYLAARTGVQATLLRAWTALVRYSVDHELHGRGELWAMRCLDLMERSIAELDGDDEREAFLAWGERRSCVALIALFFGAAAEQRGDGAGHHPHLERLRATRARASWRDARGLRAPRGVGVRSTSDRLLEISRAMKALRDPEELLPYLRDRLCEVFGAEHSDVVLVGRDGALQILGASGGGDMERVSQAILHRALRLRRPLLIRDVSLDPTLRERASVRRLGLFSVLCAPLIVNGRCIGALHFDHCNSPRPFSEEDLRVLELFSNHAAVALDNALLVADLERALEDRRAMEARLVTDERMRALGETAAGVAHDLNNHLMVILGSIGLMRSRGAELDRSDPLVSLRAGAEAASETVRHLLEFSGEPVSGHTTRVIDVRDSVRRTTEMMRRHPAWTADHRLVVELGASPRVDADVTQLSNVLLNLILNACESMPEGGVVRVRTLEEGGRTVIEVEDEGSGIDEEVRRRIFEPFFTSKPGGKGLGLSITWGIVRRMSGTVEAVNGADGGALFRVVLPAAAAGSRENREVATWAPAHRAGS